jgi:hypothetical protein
LQSTLTISLFRVACQASRLCTTLLPCRSSPCPDSNSEAEDELAADPIESADESADEESAAARDADFQPEEEEMAAGDGEEEEEEDVELAHQSDESGWDIEESEEEVLPQRRDRK